MIESWKEFTPNPHATGSPEDGRFDTCRIKSIERRPDKSTRPDKQSALLLGRYSAFYIKS